MSVLTILIQVESAVFSTLSSPSTYFVVVAFIASTGPTPDVFLPRTVCDAIFIIALEPLFVFEEYAANSALKLFPNVDVI